MASDYIASPGSPSSAAAHELARGLLAARRTALEGERTVLDPGAVVDRYVVLRQLGRGGMGIVYLAHDPELDRKVALKLLAPHAVAGSDEIHTRLLREAQALARLSHPNVVAVYDVGTHAGGVWIAMEFIAGQTLRVWEAQPRRWSEILRVLIDVARGVTAAHAAGLVHRDLKPDNVMIGSDGRVRVMDFGLAHGRGPASDSSRTLTLPSGAEDTPTGSPSSWTATGAIQGTPAYMAPEQWDGRAPEPATDQFGWSVMAWELLYGAHPFANETPATLAAAALSGPRPPPSRGRAVPGWLRRVVERGLAGDPTRRWPTMAALLTALERGQMRARLRTAVVVLASAALLTAGAAGLRRWDIARRVAACEAAGAKIDETWNDDARLRLRDALVATGVPYAATTAEKTMPWLDERAEMWKQARTAVCQNADVLAVWDADLLDRALWCLEDREMELTSLIAELGRASAPIVQAAVIAAARLRPVDSCLDERWLQRHPASPPRDRAAIRAVRADLSRAYSLELAGDFATALTVATTAREQARTMPDWPPLLADALVREGNLLVQAGDLAAAETASAEAYYTAASAGAWGLAAEAAIDLTSNVGDLQERFDHGREWAKHARMTLVHAGDPEGLWEAARLNNLANIHQAAGEYGEAQALNERVVAIHEQILGPDHPKVGLSLLNLAHAHHKLDAHVEAQALYERALRIFERALGSDHPRVAQALGHLATSYAATGKHAEARLLHERSLALTEKIYGADHYHVANSLNNLAILHVNTGDLAAARALLERALAINERTFGPDHLDVARNLANLAALNHRADDHAIALARYERVLAIREKALGSDHIDVALALSSVAYVLLDLRRDRDAIPLLERAMTIFATHEGIQYGELTVKYGLATALFFTKGDRARVLALVTEVRDGARDSGDAAMQAEAEKFLTGNGLQ